MKLLLTSCGLETKEIEKVFLTMLSKETEQAKALFIPTAAIDEEAKAVLPKCLEDLTKVGFQKTNIETCDITYGLPQQSTESYDVVYITGGNTEFLMKAMVKSGFNKIIEEYIRNGGIVIGVSAGAMIFAKCVRKNLKYLHAYLEVHVEPKSKCIKQGKYSTRRIRKVKLGNEQAIIVNEKDFQVIG